VLHCCIRSCPIHSDSEPGERIHGFHPASTWDYTRPQDESLERLFIEFSLAIRISEANVSLVHAKNMKSICFLLLYLFVLGVHGTICLLYGFLTLQATLGIVITSPTNGTLWNSSGQNTIAWIYNSTTDPFDMAISLQNTFTSLVVILVDEGIFHIILF